MFRLWLKFRLGLGLALISVYAHWCSDLRFGLAVYVRNRGVYVVFVVNDIFYKRVCATVRGSYYDDGSKV